MKQVGKADLIDFIKMQMKLKQSFEVLQTEQTLDLSKYRDLRLLDTKLVGPLSTFESLPTSDHISLLQCVGQVGLTGFKLYLDSGRESPLFGSQKPSNNRKQCQMIVPKNVKYIRAKVFNQVYITELQFSENEGWADEGVGKLGEWNEFQLEEGERIAGIYG